MGGYVMKTPLEGVLIAMLVSVVIPALAAQANTVDEKYEKWQLKRLFNPDQRQLSHEQAGMVFIYDSLKSKDVDRVMTEQFHRLNSMMFIGTIITDEKGKPLVNPETGLAMIEDDGC